MTRVGSGITYLRHALAGSPGRLRLLATLCVLAAVAAGIGGAAALDRRASALADARSAARHLVLLQGVQTNLVQADADATNSFLQFGLEPLASRQQYLSLVEQASNDLAPAAEASPADARALGPAIAALNQYSSYIASARVNSGQPLGASYLQAAGAQLRSTIVPQLQARSNADLKAIDDAYSRAGNARWWLALAAIVGLGVLLYAQLWLTRATHRYVNPPGAVAVVVLLVVLVVSALGMASAQRKANDVRDGALTAAIDISSARVAAFDAKSQESLSLIVRGSAGADDPVWKADFAAARKALPAGLTEAGAALSTYGTLHDAIHARDKDNQWLAAVRLAKASGKGTANAAFTRFAEGTQATLKQQSTAAAAGLGDADDLLRPAAILMLLAGLLAAAGAWWGISLRLDEYR